LSFTPSCPSNERERHCGSDDLIRVTVRPDQAESI
jgi:hypothetical protein